MTHASAKPQRGYLSLLLRPEQLSEEELADVLYELITTDRFALRQQCKQAPPCIIASVPLDEANDAVARLSELGCTVFAPTLAELMSLGPSLQVKFIHLKSHGIQIETWRAGVHIIQPQDIDVIINAKIKVESKKLTHEHDASSILTSRKKLHGSAGMEVLAYPPQGEEPNDLDIPSLSSPSRTTTQFTCKLDLHVNLFSDRADSQVFHVNADKFGFEVLGLDKEYSDTVNTDKLAEFFAALAPDAAWDSYWEFFKAPHDHHRLRIPKRGINNDHPAFAFYSRWAALMYRYLATMPE